MLSDDTEHESSNNLSFAELNNSASETLNAGTRQLAGNLFLNTYYSWRRLKNAAKNVINSPLKTLKLMLNTKWTPLHWHRLLSTLIFIFSLLLFIT